MQNKSKRLTLFVMHGDDDTDYKMAKAWLIKWAAEVNVVDYSTGGWEHLWDIEATPNAAVSVPEGWLCSSEWSEPALFEKVALAKAKVGVQAKLIEKLNAIIKKSNFKSK